MAGEPVTSSEMVGGMIPAGVAGVVAEGDGEGDAACAWSGCASAARPIKTNPIIKIVASRYIIAKLFDAPHGPTAVRIGRAPGTVRTIENERPPKKSSDASERVPLVHVRRYPL